jgi:PAS domain S-box-containing protein
LKDVVGRRVSEVVPGIRELDPEILEIFGRVASTGTAERFEIYLKAMSAWFDISAYSPAKDHFVAIFDVITERKRMGRSLELFRALIDHSNDTFEVLDPATGRILDVNENGCVELGYRRDEYLALSVFDIDPMVDRASFAAAIAQVRASGALTWEGLHRRKDGSTFPVEVGLKYVSLDRDYVVAVSRNVTERKRVQREHSQFKLGLTRSSDAIFLTTPDGAITYVNPAFEELYGFSSEEVIGKTPRVLRSSAQDPTFYERFWQKLAANEVVHVEMINKAKDGTLVHVDATVNPILDDQGTRIGFLAIQRDITERKEADERHDRLEAQLRASQKMEAIGSLAGGIAHDFNNLLSVILSYAGFALSSLREGDPLRDDLLEVKKAGERAAALTHQLLAFSRKQVLLAVPLDLNEIAVGIEKLLRRVIGEDVELSLVLAPDVGLTLADRGQIEQVLMNLAVNARDAMPAGGRLTIQTSNVELDEEQASAAAMAPGPYVLLTVADTGCGMDEATRARIFEPFFTTKQVGKGTGLGLSTVYGIVKQSGGNIEVQSTPGQGTSFTIHLPRSRSAVAAASRTAPPRSPGFIGTETILVVEDELAVRKLVERILRADGYTVLTAADGAEALQICDAHEGEIHLVLTDVVLPQMSGKAIAERLVRHRPQIRVLYMSGYSGEAIAQRGVLEAGVALLAKPFSPTALTSKVREVLDQEWPSSDGGAT